MDNYSDVISQMEAFGVEFTPRDLPLQIPTPKRKTCGRKGKYWYWLQLWRPRGPDGQETGRELVVGRFGTYKHGGSDAKVELDALPLSEAEKARFRAEREAAAARARQVKAEAAARAEMTAVELWHSASRSGRSPYLERKGVQPESCRYLPDGSIVVPLLRYDMPREQALKGVQTIRADGFKLFTKGFAKTGCAVRLGQVDDATPVVLVCEGYATGLSIRAALDHAIPVYVALDAYNLAHAVPIIAALHPKARLLICADDDWKSADHDGANPGRSRAREIARLTPRCDIVWPVFAPSTREAGDTDFNDLHQRQGLEAVSRQLGAVVTALLRRAIGGR